MALFVLILFSPPQAALEAAAACYEALDYGCAEERLAEALAAGLDPQAQIRARRYEALLALAFRDEARMRRAARAIFALDPDFEDPSLPPRLQRVFATSRPAPPPPPRALGRLDVTSLRTSGADADRWSEGLGVSLETGVLLADRIALTAVLGFSDHAPRLFVDDGLDLWMMGLGASWRAPVGPLRIRAGVAAGVAAAQITGALADDGYWGGWLMAPVDLSWPIWRGWGVGGRAGAMIFATSDAERLATSWLFPLTVGLRYGP